MCNYLLSVEGKLNHIPRECELLTGFRVAYKQ